MADADPEEGLIQAIQEIVRKHWEEKSTACHLTYLGTILQRNTQFREILAATRLRPLVDRLPSIKLVQHPKDKLVWGAVPIEVDQPIDKLFPERAPKATRPRLEREFWQAFIDPLAGPRFVILGDDHESPRFRILNGEPPTGTRAFEILQTDLANAVSGGLTFGAVWQKIDIWLSRHRLTLTPFIFSDGLNRASDRIYDRLAAALAALSKEDQARIAIPLDIVAKIFRA